MGTPDDGAQGPQSSMNKKLNRKPKYSRFTQQELPDLKPVLSPKWITGVLISVGIVFIPVGLLTFSASQHVVEAVCRYDKDCMPETMNYTTYIQNPETKKDCYRSIIIPKKMRKPIYIYYELTNFYQNHRRYMDSRSGRQLRSKRYEKGSDVHQKCGPEAYLNGDKSKIIVPCGIIAWTLFNDTYEFSVAEKNLSVSKKGISWFHDPKYKFGSDVYPKNFQNGSLIGGAKLDPSIPLSEQEDLIVWMRTAPLPTFRKLYGKIQVDLEADQRVDITIQNNYNTYIFGGEKKLILSTASWLGGKNNFLGKAYLEIGVLSLLMAMIFTVLYYVKPRRFGDPYALSWRKDQNSREFC